MSEQAPEAPARTSRRENVFTRHIGPLPMWQWLAIAAGLVGVYVIYDYRKKSSAANASQNSAAGAGTGGMTSGAQVPQFVNQTYTYVQPPLVQQPPPSSVATQPPGPPPSPAQAPAPATLQYLPGGYPGGPGAAAAQTSTGTAYNFSASQLQAMGFPNLRGMTIGQAQQALAGYAGGKFTLVNNNNLPAAARITSFTPYSNGQVRTG